MNKVKVFGESMIDQTPKSGFQFRIFSQDKAAVGCMHDLVGVHAGRGEIPDGAQEPKTLVGALNFALNKGTSSWI
jgi:hypothetical protein